MRLVLHILKKDVRHHWPAIFVSLLLLAVYAWEQPRRWASQEASSKILGFFLSAVPALLIISWLFLLIRVVHDEPLVGDRQFWWTRPYTRPKLLAAKLLTALLFIHLPLFVVQLVLMQLAFFPVAHSLPELLAIHSMLFLVLVSYGLALGSITSGMVQVVLSLLVLTAGVVGVGSLFEIFPGVDFTSDFLSTQLGLVLALSGVIVATVQYTFRKTWLSRLLGLSSILGIAAIMLLSLSPRVVNHYLPGPSAAHPLPVKFTFDRTSSFAHQPGATYSTNRIALEFPLLVEDIPEDTVLHIRGAKLDLELPDRQWTSDWRSTFDSVEFGRSRTWPAVEVPNSIFSSPSSNHVRARIWLAIDIYRSAKATALSFNGEKLHFADGSRCTIDPTGLSVKCFAALKDPSGFALYSDLPNPACPASTGEIREPWATLPATYFNFSRSSSADVLLSPVSQSEFSFSRRHVFEDLKSKVPVCSSTRFLFATLKYQYTVRAEVELGDIKLLNYLPTFPRKIVPPSRHQPLHEPSDTLSFNFAPSNFYARR